MGRLGCKCGKTLSSVDSPNEIELMLFEGSVISRLMNTHPDIFLADVMLDHDIPELFCWYCKDCERVYVFREGHQMYNRLYQRQEHSNEISLNNILQLREFYAYTDKQIQNPIDKNANFTLSDFFKKLPHPYRYYITEDLSMVYAYNMDNQSIAHCYVLEAAYDDESNSTKGDQ